jgi:hypothetical protein
VPLTPVTNTVSGLVTWAGWFFARRAPRFAAASAGAWPSAGAAPALGGGTDGVLGAFAARGFAGAFEGAFGAAAAAGMATLTLSVGALGGTDTCLARPTGFFVVGFGLPGLGDLVESFIA